MNVKSLQRGVEINKKIENLKGVLAELVHYVNSYNNKSSELNIKVGDNYMQLNVVECKEYMDYLRKYLQVLQNEFNDL